MVHVRAAEIRVKKHEAATGGSCQAADDENVPDQGPVCPVDRARRLQLVTVIAVWLGPCTATTTLTLTLLMVVEATASEHGDV